MAKWLIKNFMRFDMDILKVMGVLINSDELNTIHRF